VFDAAVAQAYGGKKTGGVVLRFFAGEKAFNAF